MDQTSALDHKPPVVCNFCTSGCGDPPCDVYSIMWCGFCIREYSFNYCHGVMWLRNEGHTWLTEWVMLSHVQIKYGVVLWLNDIGGWIRNRVTICKVQLDHEHLNWPHKHVFFFLNSKKNFYFDQLFVLMFFCLANKL